MKNGISLANCTWLITASIHLSFCIQFGTKSVKLKKFYMGNRKMKDNGGRRLVIDRRKCTNFDHFPERRTLRFRRSELDRRKGRAENSRLGAERRAIFR